MIIPEKKKAVSVIMSKMGPGGDMKDTPVKPEESMDDSMSAFQAIAEDILHAIDTRSAHDLALALKAFSSECENEPDEDGEDSDEQE